jgi:hypothetical protein
MATPQHPGNADALPHPNQNILANPSSVTPGSAIEARPDYPKNPAQVPDQNSKVGAGIPQTPDYYSLGISIMEVCDVCGRAYPPASFGNQLPSIGDHMQTHATGYFDEDSGSAFGQEKEL